jgi:hypothetical protein
MAEREEIFTTLSKYFGPDDRCKQDSESGTFAHDERCPSQKNNVFDLRCPWKDLKENKRAMDDTATVPKVINMLFSNVKAAHGENILERDIPAITSYQYVDAFYQACFANI